MIETLKLSISLMTSNRKDTICKCLDSLAHLRATIPSELVIVDTGCDEEMLEIIRKYTDQIVKFEWCNDFAAARNAGLHACTGNWFLFLDDDEWFEDTKDIEDFFLSGDCNHYGEASYVVRNYGKPDGSIYQDGFVKRIIRLDEKTTFVGRIHESLLPSYEEKKVLKSFVHHYGYAFPDRESNVRHSYRNIIPLREGVLEEPDNMHWRVQLALEYISVGEYRSLQVLCEEALELLEGKDSWADNIYRGSFYAGLVESLCLMGQIEQALILGREFVNDKRNSKLAQICLYYWMAICEGKRKNKDGVLQAARGYQMLEAEFMADPESFWKDDMIVVRDAVDDGYRRRIRELIETAEADSWEDDSESKAELPQKYLRLTELESLVDQEPENIELCFELLELYYDLGEPGRQEQLAERCLSFVADELRQLVIAFYVDAVFTECRYDKTLEALRIYGVDSCMSDVTLGLLFCEACIAEHRLQHQEAAVVYGKAYLEHFLKYHEMVDDMPSVIGMAYRMSAYELVREALETK